MGGLPPVTGVARVRPSYIIRRASLPADEYRARLDARGATHAALIRTDLRFSQARLAVFGVLVLLAVLAWPGVVSAWWLLAPALALAVLIQRHDRVVRAREAAARAVAFYERGLARMEDR